MWIVGAPNLYFSRNGSGAGCLPLLRLRLIA